MATDDTTVTPPANEGLTTEELEGVIGKVVDARLAPIASKLETLTVPDMEAFKKTLIEDVTGIVTANAAKPVDEEGLLTRVGTMLDEKMKGISNTPAVKRVGGPLSRWLTGS